MSEHIKTGDELRRTWYRLDDDDKLFMKSQWVSLDWLKSLPVSTRIGNVVIMVEQGLDNKGKAQGKKEADS